MISIELKSHFLRLYQMAFADDKFDVLEMQMLYNFAKDRGVIKEELNQVLLHPATEVVIPDNLTEKIEYLYDLAIMIWADQEVTEDERITLNKYCLKFGFLEENVAELSDFLLEKAKLNLPRHELLKLIEE